MKFSHIIITIPFYYIASMFLNHSNLWDNLQMGISYMLQGAALVFISGMLYSTWSEIKWKHFEWRKRKKKWRKRRKSLTSLGMLTCKGTLSGFKTKYWQYIFHLHILVIFSSFYNKRNTSLELFFITPVESYWKQQLYIIQF